MRSKLESIPPNWKKLQFQDIAQIVTERIDNPKESGLDTYIGLEHLDTDEIRIKRYGTPDEVGATKFICKKGDIIFGKRRAYLRKVAVSDRPAVVSAHSMVLRPNIKEVNTEFLPCFMQSSQFWRTAFAISEGSLSPTIKWKTLAAQEFWLPPINDQRRIAKILWAVEDNLEKLEKLMHLTQKLQNELLEELLSRGIGHKKFKKTELGNVPESWNVIQLDECLSINSETLPESSPPDMEINYVDISGIERTGSISNIQKIRFKDAPSRARRIARKGDVIISTVRPTLKAFAPIHAEIKNLVCSTGFAVLRPKKGVLQDYVYYYVLSETFIAQVSLSLVGSNYPAINPSELKQIRIALPPIIEQQKIAEILATTDTTIQSYHENHIRLKELKKKLTNELTSGKLLIPSGVKI